MEQRDLGAEVLKQVFGGRITPAKALEHELIGKMAYRIASLSFCAVVIMATLKGGGSNNGIVIFFIAGRALWDLNALCLSLNKFVRFRNEQKRIARAQDILPTAPIEISDRQEEMAS